MSAGKMVVVFGIGAVVCGIALIVIVTFEHDAPMDRQIIML